MRPTKFIRFDWAIKKLLRSKANFSILEGFLSELLKKNVTIIEILESESNKEVSDGKYNKVDILVKLGNEELVLIEVQVNNESDYFYRMLFGTSKIVTEHIKEGESYGQIKKVYSVNILYFDLGHGKDYIYHGTTSFTGLHENDVLALNEKQQEFYKKEKIHHIYPEYYLIKVNNFNDIAKDTLDEWVYFLKNEEIKENFHAKGLPKAKEVLDTMKLSPQERDAYHHYIDDLRYQESMVKSNIKEGRIEGFQEGEKAGIEKGEKIGVEKGKLEGEKIGIEKGKMEGEKAAMIKVAKQMKTAKLPAELIKQCTGLMPEEIM